MTANFAPSVRAGMRSVMLLAAATFAAAGQAADPAGDYPNRTIRIVSASGAGSANDILARVVGQALAENLKQPVVVDNRPGASGALGAELVAKAAPDGYTLMLGFNGNLAALRALRKTLPYDSLKDFDPVTLAASIPGALVVHPSVPAHSVKELIALAKSRPWQLNFATYGVGSGSHMAGELFKSMAKINITGVSYKSSTQGVTDLAGGHVHLMIHSAPVVLPLARAGKLRALAVTSAKRSAAAPELPTLSEAGVPGYELNIWFGFLVPVRTPPRIVERLNVEIVRVLKAGEMRDLLLAQGYEAAGSTPEEFTAYLRAEIARYAKIVADAGIAAE
jgi:tripartite-type tricarboxylate transporter receptor subunit TctC